MDWLIGSAGHAGEVAAKAALMYLTALIALRLGERRTLAQWTIIDFATAVAMGAIIGRTALADQSYLTGAVALATLVATHRVVAWLRFTRAVGKLVDHRVRVLVSHGELRRHELRKCSVTENDLESHLRQRGFFDLSRLRYVLYESKGDLTIVPEPSASGDPPLVHNGLVNAANYH